MNFHISKCKFMSICRKVKIDFDYSIDNNILSRVTEFNDLGITITTKLSWCENVKTVSSKAHSMVGRINFYCTARLWNTLPFVIRYASSLQIFKKNLNILYLAMVNLFDVNNQCTWSLACACVSCQI